MPGDVEVQTAPEEIRGSELQLPALRAEARNSPTRSIVASDEGSTEGSTARARPALTTRLTQGGMRDLARAQRRKTMGAPGIELRRGRIDRSPLQTTFYGSCRAFWSTRRGGRSHSLRPEFTLHLDGFGTWRRPAISAGSSKRSSGSWGAREHAGGRARRARTGQSPERPARVPPMLLRAADPARGSAVLVADVPGVRPDVGARHKTPAAGEPPAREAVGHVLGNGTGD